jgi:hypothetical protein
VIKNVGDTSKLDDDPDVACDFSECFFICRLNISWLLLL